MAEPATDLEQLKQQKERLELKAQIAALAAPWWRKASLVATMTAIVAAILPVKTAIEEHYASEREFRLQRVKQQHEIRMAYLDRFEVPGHRLQTLRFLLATTTDKRLVTWAQAEQKLVQAEVDEIEKQLRAIAAQIEKAPPGQGLEELKQMYEKLKERHGQAKLGPSQDPDPAPQ